MSCWLSYQLSCLMSCRIRCQFSCLFICWSSHWLSHQFRCLFSCQFSWRFSRCCLVAVAFLLSPYPYRCPFLLLYYHRHVVAVVLLLLPCWSSPDIHEMNFWVSFLSKKAEQSEQVWVSGSANEQYDYTLNCNDVVAMAQLR